MALIIDPDLLTDGVEIKILTGSQRIQLTHATGNLGDDGVTLKCVYSKAKELWRINAGYIAFPFPFTPITDEQFEIGNGWDWDKTQPITSISATANLLRTGGWALKNTGGTTIEEWAGIVSLGTLAFANAAGRVYYQQGSNTGSATNVILQVTGGVNQAVQIYQGVSGTYTSYKSSNNIDDRSYFKIFSREYGKTYDDAALVDIGVSTMTYQVYRLPLANATDLKIQATDAAMTGSPYASMSITYYTSSFDRSGLVGGTFPFHVLIYGFSGSTQQIYEFVQYQLRQNTNINSGSTLPPSTGSVIGKTANLLLQFVGDTLYTLAPAAGSGTFIDSILATNINDVFFVDDSGTNRYYPYSAVITLQFGENLQSDSNAVYRVFFTNDDAGDNTGRDFGTSGALTVQDSNSVYMSGNVGGSASVAWTFNYDSNVQRGTASSGTDAPVTVVALGLSTAQYVKQVGTIERSKTNAVSLAAALERNYSNPA